MKGVDLIGATVYDRDGREVGVVHDIRLRRGGPVIADSGRPAYRVTALECGPAGFAHRLGYGHRDLAGPWPLNRLLGRWMRRSSIVGWDQIDSFDGRRITLTVPASDVDAIGDVR